MHMCVCVCVHGLVPLIFCIPQEQEQAAILGSYHALSEQAERLDCTVQQSVKNQSSFQLELSVITQVQNLYFIHSGWQRTVNQEIFTLKVFHVLIFSCFLTFVTKDD